MNKAIFWDFHGTLAYSDGSLWTSSMFDILESSGYGVERDVVKAHMRKGYIWQNPEKEYPMRTGKLWWNDLLVHMNELYSAHGIPETLHASINEAFRARVLDSGKQLLYPDTMSALQQSRELGFKNILLSNNYPELTATVEDLGLTSFFDGQIVSAQVGYEKPNPRIFELALGMTENPDICFMVGDNPVADMEGGKAAGMKTILVHSEADAPHADYVCSELREIIPILMQS